MRGQDTKPCNSRDTQRKVKTKTVAQEKERQWANKARLNQKEKKQTNT